MAAKKGVRQSEEHKRKRTISMGPFYQSLKGRPSPKPFKKGHVPWNKGLKGYNSNEKHPQWKGGITPLNHKLRGSFEYRLWHAAVLRRDKWSCVWCGYRSCKKINGRSDVEVDHIKPFAYFPELRFAIDNGRTLCVECHKSTDTYKKRVV